MAHAAYVTSVEQKGARFVFTMYERARVAPQRIPELIESFHGDLSIRTDTQAPCFFTRRRAETGGGNEDPLEIVKNVLIGLKGLIEA